MSAEVIQAKYEALEGIAKKFSQQSEAGSEMYGRIQQAVQSLEQGGWEGQGASAFFAEMNQTVNPTLQRLISALEEAQTVTLQIKDVLQAAEEEAAAPFKGEGEKGFAAGFAGISGTAFAGANISGATANIGASTGSSVWGGIKDFFGGAYAEGKDMVSGLWNMVRHPVDTAKGLWHGVTHPGELWDAIKKPYVDDWNNGHPWRAIGRGTMALVTTVLGTKGADKAAKAAKASRAARVAAEASEMGARYGNVVDDVARAAGTTAKASRAETAAARFIADQSTHAYPGAITDRVVLGGFKANPGKGYLGYIGEAQANGGRVFSTTGNVWDIMRPVSEGGNGRIWTVNREFLQTQLEKGVPRIELRGESIAEVFADPRRAKSYTAAEINYLQKNAYQYGYRLEGNSWVKVGDWRASTGGRVAGGAVGPGASVINDANQ